MQQTARAPLHVVSFGGSGSKMVTTSLFNALGMTAVGLRVEELHSHLRRPPADVPPRTMLVYVFSDPRNAVLSFFQRRLCRHAAHNFRPSTELNKPVNDWVIQHLKRIGIAESGLSADHDLSSYLAEGRDAFRLDEHVGNWLHADYPILFLRYEDLWQKRDAIASFLSLPDLSFPPPIRRAADWTRLSPADRAGIDRIYGGLAADLARLPGAFCRWRGRNLPLAEDPTGASSLPARP